MQLESVCGVGGLLDSVIIPAIVVAGLATGLAGVFFYEYKKKRKASSQPTTAEGEEETAKAGAQ